MLSDFQGSTLWAVASGFGFLGAGFAPRVMDRQGLVGTLRWALILMVAGQLGMAASPALAFALASCVAFGFSLGLLGVVQNLLVLQAGPADKIQRLQAGLHSCYAGASLLAPLFLSGLAVFFSGWRAGYLGGAVLSFIGLIILLGVKSTSIEAHHEQMSTHSQRGKFPRWQVLWVASALTFYVVMEIMVSSRLALFLRREAHFDFQESSFATTLFFVGLFVGRVLFIFWQPPFRLKTQMMLSLFGTMVLMLMALNTDPRWLVLTGVTMAPFYPLGMSYLGEKFPKHLGGATASTMALTGAFVVMMHLGFGSLSESLGIVQAVKIGPIAGLLAMGLLGTDSIVRKVKI